ANDASSEEQTAVSLAKGRVEARRDHLRNVLLPALGGVATALAAPAATIDDALSQLTEVVGQFAAYRLPQTGTGFAFEWRAGAYTALAQKVADRVGAWDKRLARFDTLLAAYDARPPTTPEPERIANLQAAEIVISTQLTVPTPGTAAAYRTTLDARRA